MQTAYYNLTLNAPSAAGIDIYINSISGIVNGYLGLPGIFFPSAALNNDTALSGADQYLSVADGIGCAGIYPCTVYIAISSPALLGSSATYTLLASECAVAAARVQGTHTTASGPLTLTCLLAFPIHLPPHSCSGGWCPSVTV